MEENEEESGKLVDPASHYHDFSTSVPNPMEKEGAQNFPMKMHMILSNPEFQDIASWLPHGRSWRILQHKAFEERVIPLYFRHGRYSSFARQVNGWSFKRITCGPDYNSYYHEMFLRGKPHLCRKMKRLASKEAKEVEADRDAPVPDFYAISREYPLPELQGFRSTDESGGSAGYSGSRDEEIATLERRRQEILQRFTSLQPGSAAPQVPDANASIMMLLNMQQQQQQQIGSSNLTAMLAALAGGMNQSSLASANALGYPSFGIPSLTQAQSAPLAQLLTQYQQTGPGGSAFPGPAPASSLGALPLNLSEALGQSRQNPSSQTGIWQGSTAGLPGLAALLGNNNASLMASAGAGNANSNQFLLQQLLSGASGNGADLAALLQTQPVVSQPPVAERKISDDRVAASTSNIQNQSITLEELQRQLMDRVPDQAPVAAAAAPMQSPAPASMTSASLDMAEVQKALIESGGSISPALLAILQKQVTSLSTASAPAPALSFSGQDVASVAASSSQGEVLPSLSNNILSLMALVQNSSAAPVQAMSQPVAPPQDDMQRQLLNALTASSAALNPNAPGPAPIGSPPQHPYHA